MRALMKLSTAALLLAILALAVIAWLALADAPLVDGRAVLTPADIARAELLVRRQDPRAAPAGSTQAVEVSEQDLELGANYLLQRFAGGQARLALTTGRLQIAASVPLPRLPWRRYLNVESTVRAADGALRVEALRVGHVALPPALAEWAVHRLLATLSSGSGRHPLERVEGVELLPGSARLTYRWTPTLIADARDRLLTGSDRAALRLYHDRLVELADEGLDRSGALVDWLAPLFALAATRSATHDPVAENTALLTVLGTWASRRDLAQLVPGAPRRPGAFRMKLQGRRDFAQHFLTSAALAARGDSVLSDAVGLFKELTDTDHGSGFSFTDIAADRAGSRFGALATGSAAAAHRVQRRLAAGVRDGELMPPARDLPEHLHAAAFSARFGHVGSPAYQALMAEIERRIDDCALYREFEVPAPGALNQP